MTTTVICHFYNEEYLLPWWLMHHVKMFDHGILIDYNSTDKSVEICRALAPKWEIRSSRNDSFAAESCDAEVMDIERSLTGWKIALNVTEFLCCRHKLNNFVNIASQNNLHSFATNGVVMVDPLGFYPQPTYVKPLVEQRFYGFFEADNTISSVSFQTRNRLLHDFPDGAYLAGRHSYNRGPVYRTNDLMLMWFAFSPWTQQMIDRKLQIQNRIPISDKLRGFGRHHLVDDAELEKLRFIELSKSYDIRKHPLYVPVTV